ncbi:hypothetical protein, partial [Burkholderia pseudomallei]|uniref:hypothetical protein n=1 Tax=Burkholderia pseudomallei TaxID=28450 RepID=UPI0011AFC609
MNVKVGDKPPGAITRAAGVSLTDKVVVSARNSEGNVVGAGTGLAVNVNAARGCRTVSVTQVAPKKRCRQSKARPDGKKIKTHETKEMFCTAILGESYTVRGTGARTVEDVEDPTRVEAIVALIEASRIWSGYLRGVA